MSEACCNMLYCTFRRCVHKLYAITLTMIGEVKTEPRVFSVCDVCVTDSRSSPHSGTAGQSKRSQVEPLVQKENFLPRYYRRRARRLACSNQTVSPPAPPPPVTLTLTCCQIVPSTRHTCLQGEFHPLLSFLFFLSLWLYLHFQNTFFFYHFFLIFFYLSWRLFDFVAFNCTQPN